MSKWERGTGKSGSRAARMTGSLGAKVFGDCWLFSLQRRQKADLVTALRLQVAAERRRYPHQAG